MTTAQLSPSPVFQFIGPNGLPLAYGKLYSYAAGTSTPQVTYPSSSEATPNTNPIILSSFGTCNLWLDPSLSYKLNLTDSNGNQIPNWPVDNIQGFLAVGGSLIPSVTNTFNIGSTIDTWANGYFGTQVYVAGIPIYSGTANIVGYYGRSASELAAGVTPTNFYVPYGGLGRYGADPTGVASSSAALASALACNSCVFDDFPGGGSYLFSSQVTITTYPITLHGQGKRLGADFSGTRGTLFTLASGVSSLFLGAYLDGVNIRDIGFAFAPGSSGQYIFEINTVSAVAGQLRASTFENIACVGTGAGDTNVFLYTNTGTGGSQYSAFNTIRGCVFDAVSGAVLMAGNTTPNFMYGNTFLGYTGAGSAKSGTAIQINSAAGANVIIGFNYFEGWTQGIYANQSTGLAQLANNYQACTYSFNWVAAAGVINNSSIGEIGVAGTYSGLSSLDGSQIQSMGALGWLATGGAIQSTRGFQEGNGAGSSLRAAYLGYQTTASPTMTANGGGSISAQTTTTWSYSLVGGTLSISFEISATLTGATTTVLSVPLPLSLSAIVASQNPCSITNNGSTAFGVAYVNSSGGALLFSLGAAGSGDFTAGSVAVYGQICIRVVS